MVSLAVRFPLARSHPVPRRIGPGRSGWQGWHAGRPSSLQLGVAGWPLGSGGRGQVLAAASAQEGAGESEKKGWERQGVEDLLAGLPQKGGGAGELHDWGTRSRSAAQPEVEEEQAASIVCPVPAWRRRLAWLGRGAKVALPAVVLAAVVARPNRALAALANRGTAPAAPSAAPAPSAIRAKAEAPPLLASVQADVDRDAAHQAGEVLAYRISQVLAMSAWWKLFFLVMLGVPLVAAGGYLYMLATDQEELSFSSAMYFAYAILNNIPGTDLTGDDTFWGRMISNIIYCFGLLTFAVFLGVVCDEIQDMVQDVKTGNHRVVETGHTVVLNWNRQGIPLLRQMAIAKDEGRSAFKRPVVVLCSQDKEGLDAAIADELDGASLKVVTRNGDPFSLDDLERVGARSARTVIVLHPDGAEENGSQAADIYMEEVRKSTAILALNNGRAGQSVVVQMRGSLQEDEDIVSRAINSAKIMDQARGMIGARERQFLRLHSADRVGEIFASAALQPGLSRVLTDVLVQDEGGVELYLTPAKKLVGQTFGSSWRRFNKAVLLGWVRPPPGGGPAEDYELFIAPPKDAEIREGDLLVFMADGEGDCIPGRTPHAHDMVPRNLIQRGETVTDVAERVGMPASALMRANPMLQHPSRLSEGDLLSVPSLSAPISLAPQRILVAGWSNTSGPDMASLIQRKANTGSHVTVLCEEQPQGLPPDDAYVTFSWCRGNPTSHADLVRAGARTACDTAVIVQPPHLGPHEKDALTMGTLLNLQDIWRKRGISPAVVAAAHKPNTVELIKTLDEGNPGRVETVLEDDLMSGALMQLSAHPELIGVIRDFIKVQKTDTRVRLASDYVDVSEGAGEVTFAEVCERAAVRGEVALGYFDYEVADDLHLSPPKGEGHVYKASDRIVVMRSRDQ